MRRRTVRPRSTSPAEYAWRMVLVAISTTAVSKAKRHAWSGGSRMAASTARQNRSSATWMAAICSAVAGSRTSISSARLPSVANQSLLDARIRAQHTIQRREPQHELHLLARAGETQVATCYSGRLQATDQRAETRAVEKD